jgi:hypothetical protein
MSCASIMVQVDQMRLGEWIFGGMKQALLAGSPVCSLLSH